MQRTILSLATIILATVSVLLSGTRAAGQDDDKKAAESVVRAFEQAVQDFDIAKADSLCTPDARWIEESYPRPIEPWPAFLLKAKDVKLRIDYRPQDFDVHVKGDVAWVTVTLNSIFKADNDAAKALLGGQSEWRPIFVESEILVKTPNGWRIILGHTTRIPESKPK